MESVDIARQNDAWEARRPLESCIAIEGNHSKFPSFSYMSGLFSRPVSEEDELQVNKVPLTITQTLMDRIGYSTGPIFELPKDSYLIDGKLIDRDQKKRVDCSQYKTMFNRPGYQGQGQKKTYWVQVEEDFTTGYYLTQLGAGRHTYSMIDIRYQNWKHTDAILAIDQMNQDRTWEPLLPHMMNLVLSLYRNEAWDYVYTDDSMVAHLIQGEIEDYKDNCRLIEYKHPEASSIENVDQDCHLGRALQNSNDFIPPTDACALKLNYEDENIQTFIEEASCGGSVLVLLSHHREYARDFAHQLRKIGYSALAAVVYNLQYKHDHKRLVSSSKIPPFNNLSE